MQKDNKYFQKDGMRTSNLEFQIKINYCFEVKDIKVIDLENVYYKIIYFENSHRRSSPGKRDIK